MRLVDVLRPIRDSVAARLVRTGRRLASDQGWAKLSDDLGAPSMLGGLMRLRDRGVDLQAVIDIGACQGDWTRLCRKVFPRSRVLMIEPQERHAGTLQDPAKSSGGGIQYMRTLLGPPGLTEVDFHVLDDPSGGTGSSVLPEVSDVPRQVVRMPVRTLDDVWAQSGLGDLSLVKADVQGFELEVLKGAPRILQSVPHVLLEVSLVQYNEGSPLVAEVLSWMDANGFRVEEVFDLSRSRDGILVQADFLFSRASG